MMGTIAELEAFDKRQEIIAYRAAIHAVLTVHWMEVAVDIDASGNEMVGRWCNECEMPAWPCDTRRILSEVLDRFEG